MKARTKKQPTKKARTKKQRTKKQRVWDFVRTIPSGQVMSYGGVARVLELEGLTARVVGWAMSESPEGVPWWRVVNSKGECSVDRGAKLPRQRRKLETEGVQFSATGKLSLKKYEWK